MEHPASSPNSQSVSFFTARLENLSAIRVVALECHDSDGDPLKNLILNLI